MTKLPQTKLISNILIYKKTHTLKETGKTFNLSSERIRQLGFVKQKKRCSVHNRYYYNRCSYCLVKHYRSYIRWLTYEQLLSESKKESKVSKRDYLSVARKALIVQRLHNSFQIPFGEISKAILKRHRSTIINLYNKNV